MPFETDSASRAYTQRTLHSETVRGKSSRVPLSSSKIDFLSQEPDSPPVASSFGGPVMRQVECRLECQTGRADGRKSAGQFE